MRTLSILALLPLILSAAPALKDKPTLYYATEVGTVLEYEIRSSAKDNPVYTYTIMASETKAGTTTLTIKRQGVGAATEQKCQVSESGLVALTDASRDLAKPHALLKVPLLKGETWEAQLDRKIKTKHTFQSVGEEEIEVPAGKFKTLRVDMTATVADLPALEVKYSTWYALHIGPVKMTVTTREASVNGEYLLRAIKPPKK